MSTQRYQRWTEINLIGAVAFIGLCVVLYPLTWQWGTADWGPFSLHAPSLRRAAWGLFMHNTGPWLAYWRFLGRYAHQVAFVLHAGMPLVTAAIGAVAMARLRYVPGGRDPAQHIEGPQLLTGRSAHRHAHAAYQRELTGDAMGIGVALHPAVSLPARRELGNVLAVGQQGSGKGVVLKPIIAALIARGDRAVIYDEKREYTPLFFNQNAILISPTDARSAVWNIAADARTAEFAELIAEQLIPHEHGDPFWVQGARLILTGCICVLNATHGTNWGWPALRGILMLGEKELRAMFATHYPPAARLIEEQSKTTAGFLMTITAKLGWVNTLARAWPDHRKRSFSIFQWITDKTAAKVVIVPNDPRFASISGPVCGALLNLMTAHVLALRDSDSRRIWFCLDELGNLPRCAALLTWMSLGRSKGARTLAGFQSMSQLRELYGNNGAETLLSLFASVIALRCGAAGGSAEVTAKSFGERIVERPIVSIDHQGQRSTNYQRLTEPVVRPEDLVQLPQANAAGVHGYLSIGGWQAAYRLVWPYPNLPTQAPPYKPAAWLTPATKAATVTPQRRNRRRA